MPLSKRASLQAQRVMREAFMELERVIIVSDRAQLKNLSLEDVQQAALQIEKQLAASQSLRNMRRLTPLFTGLGHYSQVIEVLCNGTPYLPWVWAPIKLVLKISADYIEAFEQIIRVYNRLAEPLARFRLFDRSFSNNIEIQNALAVYYSDILKFHGEAYKFVRRNAWKRLFATSWGRFQRRFDNLFADLKAHEDLVDKTVNAANLSEAKEMREKLEDWRKQEMAKFKKEEEERTSTEFRAVLSVLKVDETHQIRVFDNLISEAKENPGSCSWILQQPKIQSWARGERDTQFVVLHGVVGSGKSVLAAQIANFLRTSEHSLVAAHFCTYLYPDSTDYNYIMRSLMIQIIRLDPELITLSYDWLVLKKKTPNNPVVEQLLRLFVEALGALSEKQKTLHIVLDGLDECDDNTVASVIKTLDRLIASASSSAATVLKVLLCTQMRPGVAKFVKKKHQVSLSNEKDHLNKAIRDYTLQKINDIRSNLSQLRITDDDVTALASQITQKSDGMFLWAKLVMEYINKNLFYHRDEILKAAISLPRELGEFYGRMLSQIMANFDERSAQRISAVLSWIAFAKRPLRLAELLSALAFDSKEEQVDELVPAYILDRCEPLIQKQVDSSYSFVHVSVRDFLQSSDTALLVTENESQMRHGLATVRCLLSGQQIFASLYSDSERDLRLLRGLHGFHMYATQFWVDYLLSSLEFDQAQFFESDFLVLSCRLAENFLGRNSDCEAAESSLSDPRLAPIRQKYYSLYKMVNTVLLEQKKETIEATSIHDDTIQPDDIPSDIIALKKKYQRTIQHLLNYSNYSGFSFQQLEQFKQNFRTSAFTCRLWSCPYAALGFNNIDSLTQHEAEHSKHICRVQSCQYPVFTSARLLKNHVAEYHTSHNRHVPRKSIRKRPALIGLSGPGYVTSHVADQIESPEEELNSRYLHIFNCICGVSEEHLYGNRICCNACDTWQHILCFYPDNQGEAMRSNFSHSCADCKPISQLEIQVKLLIRDRKLREINSMQSDIASMQRNSPHPLAADIPRQVNPRVVQSTPPSIVVQNSQVDSQMREDVQLITEEGIQRMASLGQKKREQQQQLEVSKRHLAATHQNNRPHEDQGNGTEPKLDDQTTVLDYPLFNNDEDFGDYMLFNNISFDTKMINDVFYDEFFDGFKLLGDEQTFTQESSHNKLPEVLNDDKLDNPGFANNSSSEPSPATAASSEAFNQRISAANSQHLNAIRNPPSSNVSLDASPFHQGSSLAPLRHPDLASKPQMLGQERNIPDYNTWRQKFEQLRHKTSYPPPAQTSPYKTQGNGRPLPIPPHLKVGDPRPPTPAPAPSSSSPAADHRSALPESTSTRHPPPAKLPYGYIEATSAPPLLPSKHGGPRPPTPPPPPSPAPPLKGANFPSTLSDSTSAKKTPHPHRQTPYISSSRFGLPSSFVDAASSPPSLPPLEPSLPLGIPCNDCLRRKIRCDGTYPCSWCISDQFRCSYDIGLRKGDSTLQQSLP